MEQLFNLDKQFKRARMISIIALVSLSIIAISSIVFANKTIREYSSRIYLVDKNEKFEALVGDVNQNRKVEIQYHVQRFHELFWTVSPDPKVIDDNIEKAFFLGDESIKKLYDDLFERNYYRDMIQGNVNQKVKVDSVSVDTQSYPYRAVCYFSLTQTRSTNTVEKTGSSFCILEDVPRTLNSPNGLLIRGLKFNGIKDSKKELNNVIAHENEP